MAHLARDIAHIVEVGDEAIGLRLKLWIDIVRSPTTCDETGAVLRKIANARDQLFTFVDAPRLVEPTNNACERALRPAVINRKVTNGFRAKWAAEADAAVRTVVDTARLAGINPYSEIRQILSA